MSSLEGVSNTLFIPMEARIYASRRFPEYFYDRKALELEEKIPEEFLEKIREGSVEYTMIASVARYYNIDEITKQFIETHDGKCNVVNLGAGLETMAYRLRDKAEPKEEAQKREIPAREEGGQEAGKHRDRNPEDGTRFFEVDLPEVIEFRKEIMDTLPDEKLIGGDIFELEWAEDIDKTLPTLMIASGVFQYFYEDEVVPFIMELKDMFPQGELVFDATNEVGVKYADRYVRKTGNLSASINFYVNDAQAFADKIGVKLVEKRVFFTDARKVLKGKVNMYTRLAMFGTDRGNRAILVHLGLND